MLVVSVIRKNIDQYSLGLQKRGFKEPMALLNRVIEADELRKSLQAALDEQLNKLNLSSKKIGILMQAGKQDEARQIKLETANIKEESKLLTEKLQMVEKEVRDQLYQIPNIPNEQVAFGVSEADNELIHEGGVLPVLDEKSKPHWDLIADYNLVDFNLGNKISGAGFPFYKNQGARMVRAMINYFLDQAIASGYQEIQPPIIVNEDSAYATGQLPDKEGQMYHLSDTNLYLIPTAEVPLTNIYRDVILKDQDFPVKMVGYTPCFRREAGSWGAHVRGLNRLHQFDKVEIVQIAKPEESYEILQGMIAHIQQLIESLELPYRILRLCGKDLGFSSAITYDFEVFSAGQNKWLEVSSVSNFETYQSNRLKLRYTTEEGKKLLAHTLNGSALAVPRILAAILENNQSSTGIKMPKVLHPYLGFDFISK
ncbi:MAG: serine--tRNA ligase [Flammeovirgaceae bacterium]|jgi:seryl-tRNA synthetase|nr:serine--tRNA ligase [Flammeovirgaceae bacterium]|tara:strand:+ start:7887 stop:9164 length:1278 start_codon:yes stop_codon:yes gene_type:complete